MPSFQIPLEINPRFLWKTLSKNNNKDPLQPIWEIIDNAIANKTCANRIQVHLDLETWRGSIEDNGVGFPEDLNECGGCFAYAHPNHTDSDLNEHGCGLKTSLAILDPEEKDWRVCWKNPSGMFEFRAPYSPHIHPLTEWPGQLHEKSGAYIEFPLCKTLFRHLYQRRDAKMLHIMPRFKTEIALMWMFLPRFVKGDVQIMVNGERIQPLPVQTLHENASDFHKASVKLPIGASVDIQQFTLDKPVGKFLISQNTSGVYLFKSGRLIQHVNGGPLFEQITGFKQHNSFNREIVLVNIWGESKHLPHTVSTKDSFSLGNNPVFDEMVEAIKKNVSFKRSDKDPLELHLSDSFVETRRSNLSDVLPGYSIQERQQVQIPNRGIKTPQLDSLEVLPDKVNMYEMKKDNKVSIGSLHQTFGNWVCTREAHLDKPVVPILMIHVPVKEQFSLSEDHKQTIAILADNSKSGFPLEIRNYQNDLLWPLRSSAAVAAPP